MLVIFNDVTGILIYVIGLFPHTVHFKYTLNMGKASLH